MTNQSHTELAARIKTCIPALNVTSGCTEHDQAVINHARQVLSECAAALESPERVQGGEEPVAQDHIHLAWRGALMACGVSGADLNAISEVVLSILSATPSTQAEKQPLSDEQIAVLRFLDGVGVLRGHGFGMKPPTERGNYWWRKDLRAAFPDVDFGIVTKESST